MKKILTVILLAFLLTGCEQDQTYDDAMELYAYVNSIEIDSEIVSYDIYYIEETTTVSYFELSKSIETYTWGNELVYYYCETDTCIKIDMQQYIEYRSD